MANIEGDYENDRAAEFRALLADALQAAQGDLSDRKFAVLLGLPVGKHGLLSKVRRGLPISAESERMIGRALGIISPPRNPIRLTVPADMADAVQAERAKGRTTRDILLYGVQER